ncbi:MAG: hypothetical protein ACE5J2_05640 [Nitrososphaerales archaeon]
MQVNRYRFSIAIVAVVLTLSISNNGLQLADGQSATLSVSAAETGGKFFGPQIVQIVIDGSGTRDPDTSPGALLVNGVNVPLVHLTDSRWYAFVADQDTFTTLAGAASFPGEEVSALGGNFWTIGSSGKSLLFPSLPGAFGNDPDSNSLNPNLDLNGDCPATITDQNMCVEWPYIRFFNFNENDQVSFRYSSQSITLNYIEPSFNDVSISLDRQSYPVGAEIILTLADYMWNINPVEEDRVHFVFTSSGSEVFYQASSTLTPISITSILSNLDFDRKQILDGEGLDGIKFVNMIGGMPETVLMETAPNSAIFENFNSHADMFANKRDAQIRFDYFDKSTASGMATSDASVSIGKEEPKVGTETSKVEEEPEVKVNPYSISEPQLADLFGNRIDKIVTGLPVLVQTSVTNNLDEEQPFTYILQVKDTNGFTVMLTWIKGVMQAKGSLDTGISWMPESMGDYTLEVFVWKSIDEPGTLPLTKMMTVSIA